MVRTNRRQGRPRSPAAAPASGSSGVGKSMPVLDRHHQMQWWRRRPAEIGGVSERKQSGLTPQQIVGEGKEAATNTCHALSSPGREMAARPSTPQDDSNAGAMRFGSSAQSLFAHKAGRPTSRTNSIRQERNVPLSTKLYGHQTAELSAQAEDDQDAQIRQCPFDADGEGREQPISSEASSAPSASPGHRRRPRRKR